MATATSLGRRVKTVVVVQSDMSKQKAGTSHEAFFEMTDFGSGFGLADFSHHKAAHETPGSGSDLKLCIRFTLF